MVEYKQHKVSDPPSTLTDWPIRFYKTKQGPLTFSGALGRVWVLPLSPSPGALPFLHQSSPLPCCTRVILFGAFRAHRLLLCGARPGVTRRGAPPSRCVSPGFLVCLRFVHHTPCTFTGGEPGRYSRYRNSTPR